MHGFHAVVFHQFDGPTSGKVPPILVGGAQLECRDQFAVTLQVCLRHQARLAVIGAMRSVRLLEGLQRPIDGRYRDAVQRGHRCNLGGAFRAFERQAVKPLPQLQ